MRSSRAGLAGGVIRAANASGLPGGKSRRPVVDMIETTLFTLSGWLIATSCAIIPPIEAPTTWARAIPSASSEPDGVGSHIVERVGRGDRLAGRGLGDQRPEVGPSEGVEMSRPADVAIVEPDDPKTFGREAPRRANPASRPRSRKNP